MTPRQPLDDAARAQLLNAVLHEYAQPAHGRLGPWLARVPVVRAEEAHAVAAMPWSTFSDRTLVDVKNHYFGMLVTIQGMFGPAGEELRRDLGVLPEQPVQAGNVIRFLYIQSIVLTRQPDPLPFLRHVYWVAAAGPAAENELWRRLRPVHGGEVPRIVATGTVLAASAEQQAWAQRVVPGVAFATLAAEQEQALLDLAPKVMASLRKRKGGVWGVLRDHAVPEEGTPKRLKRRRGDRPDHPRPPTARDLDEVLAHAIRCHTLTGTHDTWGGEDPDSLVRAALKGKLALAPLRLADRYLDDRRHVRLGEDRGTLFGLDPHRPVDDLTFEVREDIETASLAATKALGRSEDEPTTLEATLEGWRQAWQHFLAAHPKHRADAKLLESDNKSVAGLARERRVDKRTIRRRKERVRAAFRAHVAGADGCSPMPP